MPRPERNAGDVGSDTSHRAKTSMRLEEGSTKSSSDRSDRNAGVYQRVRGIRWNTPVPTDAAGNSPTHISHSSSSATTPTRPAPATMSAPVRPPQEERARPFEVMLPRASGHGDEG